MRRLVIHPKKLKRIRVENSLIEAEKIPLILIVAPMGYGKSTIAHDYYNQLSDKKVWFSFGQNEKDVDWTWARLIEEFEKSGYTSSNNMSQLGIPKSDYEINCFLNKIENIFKDTCYLVLDNYDKCDSPEFNYLLEQVVLKRIKNLHIIVISRNYPSIHYEEMWIKGYCILLEQPFLALTKEEQEEFFLINDIHLSDEKQSEIYEYTEGWLIAVYLVILDYKKNGFFHNLNGINDLIRRFIYELLPEEYQKVLASMSLFDEFTAEQAAYVSGIDASVYILPRLYETIGFIKFIPQHKTYELHSALKFVVSSELDKFDLNKTELYTRCARWYEMNKEYIRAFSYYFEIDEIEQCFHLIEKCHCSIFYGKAPVLLEEFFGQVSMEEALKHPSAYLTYLNELIIHDNVSKGKRLFEEAKVWYERQEQRNLPIDKNSILGELSIMEWNLAFNDLEKMTQCAKRAYELLDGKRSSIFNFDILLTYGTPEIIVLYHSKLGELRRTVELEKQYTLYYMKLISGFGGGWDSLYDAEYYLSIGEYETADSLLDFVCEKAEYRKQYCVFISGYFAQLRIAIHKGDKERFEYYLNEMKVKLKDEARPNLRVQYDLVVGYINGIIGQADKMETWIKEHNLNACNRIMKNARVGSISYGIWLIHSKKWIRLEVLAEEMSVPYSTTKHIIVEIYSYIYYAIAKYHLNEIEESKKALKKGIKFAQQDEIKQPFVENIIEIEPILELMNKNDDYVNNLLLLGREQKKGINKIIDANYVDNSRILTKREQELMYLVERGYKNAEISDKLHIAQVTVEKTLTSIYKKLNVHNRTAALAKLKEMNLHIF